MQSISVSRRSGFTIVELLIVIVVIAILATISIVAYSGIQERARVARANSELLTLDRAIRVARESVDKTLIDITLSTCTQCVGTQAAYDQTLDRISTASGANLSTLKDGDPWGNRYAIDENVLEGGSSCVSKDSLTVSPAHAGVSTVLVPFYRCP